jgi:uncharacterized membrane protein YczE
MARRLLRLVFGLLLCGTGVSLMINADLGLSPWDVLHQGIAKHTSLSIGTAAIIVGFVVLLLWLPLKERYGLGTLLNVLLIGLTINALLAVLPDDPPMGVRVVFLLAGTFLFGPGSGYYIGVGMGPGPRDGLMTALAARGYSVRLVRTVLEVSVLIIGFALGGGVGVGTLLFAFTIGPNVHFWLERLSMEHPEPETVIGAE